MNPARTRQILAYQRAQGYAGAHVEPAAAEREIDAPKGQPHPNVSHSSQVSTSCSPPSAATASPSVDYHWLQAKIRQLNMPALRVFLAQLPAPLQRLLLPQLDKTMAAELLKRARPSQRRELLRVGRKPDEALFAELEDYYQRLFAAEHLRGGRKQLEEICRYLPFEHRRRLGLSKMGSDWQDSPSLRRMIRRLQPDEKALLLGHRELGHTVLAMLSPEERLSCLGELIRLAELPVSLRRRRLRKLLLRGVTDARATVATEKRRVGV